MSSYDVKNNCNRIKPVSKAILKSGNLLIIPCLRYSLDYSHSMVPAGFGVRSNTMRLTPLTSLVMRSVMCLSSG